MKKIGFIIFIFALAAGVVLSNFFSFGGCSFKSPVSLSFGSKVKGSGNVVTEKREIADFKSIEVSGIFEVEVVAQKEFSIEIEADDNLLELIKTEVKDGTLEIERKKRFSSRNSIKIRISAPNIEKLDNAGVSKVTIVNIANESLQIDSSGASKVKLEGTTNKLNLDISGASRIDASGLSASKVAVESSGASSARVNVSSELDADLSGASRVSYKGNPTRIDKNTSGASRISQVE